MQRLIEVVEELKAREQTMIIVEQSLNVAIALADRAIFMEKGQVRFEGSTDGLMERGDLAARCSSGPRAADDPREHPDLEPGVQGRRSAA